MMPAIKTGGKTMFDKKSEYPLSPTANKPKEQNISEIVQKNRGDSTCSSDRVDLRDLLIQRTMAKHEFTEEQALALILAFGR